MRKSICQLFSWFRGYEQSFEVSCLQEWRFMCTIFEYVCKYLLCLNTLPWIQVSSTALSFPPSPILPTKHLSLFGFLKHYVQSGINLGCAAEDKISLLRGCLWLQRGEQCFCCSELQHLSLGVCRVLKASSRSRWLGNNTLSFTGSRNKCHVLILFFPTCWEFPMPICT